MEHAHYAIRGNHDHGVAQGVEVVGESGYRYLTRVSRPLMWEALDPDERRYLLQLPLTQRVTLGGRRFLLVHGTPRDPLDEYLLADPLRCAPQVRDAKADIVCVGHTHQQFNTVAGGVVVLNPGSVGQPRDGDPRAAYAMIVDGRIELKRIRYPVEETIAHVAASRLPERAKQMYCESLRLGRLPHPAPGGGDA
jgi:putative phosphoesterase